MAQYNTSNNTFIQSNKSIFETVLVTDKSGSILNPSNVRAYNFSNTSYVTVNSTSVSAAFGTLNTDREIMLTASTDCYVAFGNSSVTVAANTVAALRMFSNERFHMRVANTITHFAVIRAASDGFLRVTPVA